MRLALIADVHANATALSALTNVLDSADRVVCLGDMTGYFCQVNESIDLLREYDPLCILGNHDYFVLHSCPERFSPAVQFGVQYAKQTISKKNRTWLAKLQQVWGGELGGLSCLFFHGSPWQPMADYLYADSPLLPQLDQFKYDLLAFGQTHRPLLRMDKKPNLINPGSVGQAREASLFGKACAVLLDTETMHAEKIAREYDLQSVIDHACENGAGDWMHKFAPERAKVNQPQ